VAEKTGNWAQAMRGLFSLQFKQGTHASNPSSMAHIIIFTTFPLRIISGVTDNKHICRIMGIGLLLFQIIGR